MSEVKRILIVDDEAEIRECVQRWLKAAGYETSMGENGRDCIELAQINHPDAILLDVQMPGKSGMQTLAVLRRNPITCDIPVIMLSASLRDEQRALDAGAKYFVPKPYNRNNLVFAIRAATEQKNSEVLTTAF